MPWCPICKNEYREGILKCADCGADLVAELEAEDTFKILCHLSDKNAADKLISYLDYSGIQARSAFIEEDNAFKISVDEKDLKKAKVEYRAFLTVEASSAAAVSAGDLSSSDTKADEVAEEIDEAADEFISITSDEDIEKLKDPDVPLEEKEALLRAAMAPRYKKAGVYQSQSDKANDYSSTGYTFLFIGIALLVFTVLNTVNVLSFFYGNVMTLIILYALSIAACGVGISAFKRSKKASAQIKDEEKLTSEINDWLESHANIMTSGTLSGDDGTPEEILYLNRTQVMKSALELRFGKLDEDYVDSLLDDFYNKHFGE